MFCDARIATVSWLTGNRMRAAAAMESADGHPQENSDKLEEGDREEDSTRELAQNQQL